MIPDPLHPAIVHFPVALASLVPLLALLALIAIRAQWLPARVWLGVVLLQAMLAGSAWMAHETGEKEEERVERVVEERYIEEHEKAGDRLLTFAAGTLAISALGLLGGGLGTAGRLLSLVAMTGVLGTSVFAGKLGGELVYQHGAAAAYTSPSDVASSQTTEEPRPAEE